MGCLDFIQYVFCTKRHRKSVKIKEQREAYIDELELVYKEYTSLYEILLEDV